MCFSFFFLPWYFDFSFNISSRFAIPSSLQPLSRIKKNTKLPSCCVTLWKRGATWWLLWGVKCFFILMHKARLRKKEILGMIFNELFWSRLGSLEFQIYTPLNLLKILWNIFHPFKTLLIYVMLCFLTVFFFLHMAKTTKKCTTFFATHPARR